MGVYGQIIRVPGVLVLLVATLLARMSIGIDGLATLLYVRQVTGSYAAAGFVVASLALGTAVGAPLQGRLVDRRGRRALVPLALIHGGGLGAIWLLGGLGAGTAALAVAALVAGAALPPVSAVLRACWPALLRERADLIQGAYALDSVLIEVVFFVGPLVTAGIAALLAPQYALGVAGICVLLGTIAFVARLRVEEEATAEAPRRLLGALASPGIRTLAVVTLPVGFCLGAIEVALPAFSDTVGDPEVAGVLLALWSLASGVAGLAYGAIPRRLSLARTHILFAVLLPLACLPLLLAASPLAMAGLVLIAGAPIAPLIASRNEVVSNVAPAQAATEAFTWPLTALVAGIALGAAAAGSIVEWSGWAPAVMAAAAIAAVGAAILLVRAGTLAPPAEARARELVAG
jgi:MFS family permease